MLKMMRISQGYIVGSIILLSMLDACLAMKICPPCGNMSVPYPLRTQPGCGDEDYRIHCKDDKELQFMSVNSTFYKILSIHPSSMRLVIQPPRLISETCLSQDMKDQGLQLNHSMPFNITSTNTVMMLNCSDSLLRSPLNCGSSSPCRTYIADMDSARACRNLSICCSYSAGGSVSTFGIRAHVGGCTAYTSVLNFNANLPPTKWSYGVEIQWATPREPTCTTQSDCDSDPNSSCKIDLNSNNKSRCFCNKPFIWNPIQGICSKNECNNSESCGGTDRRGLIGGLVTGMVAAIGIAGVSVFLYKRKRMQMQIQSKIMKERSDILSNGGVLSARLFSKKEMRKATHGFSAGRLLGSGGFGDVYKGILADGNVVAVKAAKVGNIKGTEQVLNEVRILSQLNHKNLVQLLGCCVDTEQPLMVYEYVPNGTLFDHLHRDIGGDFLDWNTRLKIATQTAQALAYMHTTAHSPIFHRDIKATNILLDKQLNAKVSDFGLSRLAEPGVSHISTCAQGTIGYLDPEYYRDYHLTDKSDVYSFGVVLLELVTSQKAIDFRRDSDYVNLAVYVMTMSEQERLMDVVDTKLKEEAVDSSYALDSMRCVLLLALGCVQEKRGQRPSMNEVVEELHYITSIQNNVSGFDSGHNTPLVSKDTSSILHS